MHTRKCFFALVLLMLVCPTGVFAQTKEEIELVTKTMGRKQTPASTLSFLAGTAQGHGKFAEALSCYDRMLKIYAADPALGNESPKYGWGLARRSQCLKALGRDEEALADSKRAIEIVSDYPPKIFPVEASYVNGAIDCAVSVMGTSAVVEYFKAKKPRRPSVKLKPIAGSEIADIDERTQQTKQKLAALAKDDREYFMQALYLANLYTLQKKYDLAEPLFKQVIDWSRKQNSERYLMVPLSNYGYMLVQSGRIDEGKRIEEELKAIDRQIEIPGLYRD